MSDKRQILREVNAILTEGRKRVIERGGDASVTTQRKVLEALPGGSDYRFVAAMLIVDLQIMPIKELSEKLTDTQLTQLTEAKARAGLVSAETMAFVASTSA